MEQERRPEVEAEPAKQPPAAHDEHRERTAATTSFSRQGSIPAVEEEVDAVQPSASDRAYGGKGHGKGKPKGGGGYDTSGTLNEETERVVDGVTIVAPASVHVSAIERVAEIIRLEVGRNQYAQARFAEARTKIVIIPQFFHMTDLPQFASLVGKKTFDNREWENVRGSGGVKAADGSFCIGVAEENLISIRGAISGYAKGYSIGMHELAHALQSKGMTPQQRARVTQLFAQQQQQDSRDPTTHHDAFTDNYAASNEREYFAQATNAFFGRNTGSEKIGNRAISNHNGRLWLYQKDPDMYAFLVEIYETDHADGAKDHKSAGGSW